MGWMFRCSTSFGRKQLIEYLRRPERFGESKLLQSCAIGNNHWYLAQTGDKVWIGLDLMHGGGREMGWGYKDLDESCGPCEVNCPISYLSKASEPVGYAAEWREKVRKYHAAKKAAPQSGDVVQSGQYKYRLIEPYAPRRGWRVFCIDDGYTYRMPAKQLSRSQLCQSI